MTSAAESFTARLVAGLADRPAAAVAAGSRYAAVQVGNRIGLARRIPAAGRPDTATAAPPANDPATPDDTAVPPSDRFRTGPPAARVPAEALERFTGRRLAHRIASRDPLARVLAAAAICAQVDIAPGDRGNVFDDILQQAERHQRIGIVGAFPFVPRLLRQHGPERVRVFEQRPLPGCLPGDRAAAELPHCDLVVITGSAFANGTLDSLLGLARGTTFVIGPSTPLTPLLFEYGVAVVAGLRASDPRILEVVARGGGTRDFKPLAAEVLATADRRTPGGR